MPAASKRQQSVPVVPVEPLPSLLPPPKVFIGPKEWWRSLGVWGAIGTIVALFFPEVGVLIKDGIQPEDIVPLITVLAGLWGRIRAKHAIK